MKIENKPIIFVIKGSLEKNVPIISQILIARKKDIKTSVICTNCDKKLCDKLIKLGVKIYCTEHKTFGFLIMKKILDWIQFKNKAFKLLKNIYSKDTLLYIGSVDTALSLGRKLLKYKYIFHIRELYDDLPWYLRNMKKYAQSAEKVVVPEYCRALILKNWLSLPKDPIVIPNKPFEHNRKLNLFIEDINASKIIENLNSKKIILYQGLIERNRNLLDIAKALKKIGNNEYVFLLMGVNYENTLEAIQKIYHNTCHIDYIAAPFHLQVTSHAYIGVVNYDDSCLNHIFCAPNKIYEYSGFGIPILARDIPGLRYTIGYSNAGVCVSFGNVQNIIDAIKSIENNYEYYSQNAKNFFDEVDLLALFDDMLYS